MTTRTQALRSSTSGTIPAVNTRLPGETWVNFADLQLGTIDASKTAQRLIAVRFFSAAANYAVGDYAVQSGQLYRAKVAITAGAFNPAQWATTGGSVLVAGAAPGNPTPGDLWWDSNGGQLYVFYDDGNTQQWVVAVNQNMAAGVYLPLTGGTLTGALAINGVSGMGLTINGAPNAGLALNASTAAGGRVLRARVNGVERWAMSFGVNTESGSNSGSDLAITNYDDTGAFISNPLTITRATGQVKINIPAGATVVNAPHVDGPAGVNRSLMGSSSGVDRWGILLASATAEGGSNAGSNFAIQRYSDAGTYIDNPLSIVRSTGFIAPNPFQSAAICGGAGTNRILSGRTGTDATTQYPRWDLILGDAHAESGSNAGSDFAINTYTDGAVYLGTPFNIKRSSGLATFQVAIVNGPSDRTLKENVEPITGALDKVNALQGVSFNMIATPDKREIGLIAQDVEPVVPEILQAFEHYAADGKSMTPKLALDYPKLVALLIEAVKELSAEVNALKAGAR